MLRKIKHLLTFIYMWIFSTKLVDPKPEEAYPNKPSVIPVNNSEEIVQPVKIKPVKVYDRRDFTPEQVKRIIQMRKSNASYININHISVKDLVDILNLEFGLNKSLRSYQRVWKDWRNSED